MTTTPVTPAGRAPEAPDAKPTGNTHGNPRPEGNTTPAAATRPPALDEGPAAAALLGAGVGAFTLGLLTTLAEASTTIKDWLALTDAVGPLSGKTTYAVIVWLIAWGVLHYTVGRRTQLTATVLTVVVVLLGLGLLGTFPVFFQLFAAE